MLTQCFYSLKGDQILYFLGFRKRFPGVHSPPDFRPRLPPPIGSTPGIPGTGIGSENRGREKTGGNTAPDTAPDFRPRPGAAPGIPGAEIGGGKKPGAVRPRNSGGGFAFSAPGIHPRNSGGGLNAFPEERERDFQRIRAMACHSVNTPSLYCILKFDFVCR